jgi:GTP-dependent phosphoenolpyruvate carboxykinase
MKKNKSPKKPLVNWFKRKKEVEYGTKKVGDKEMNVKTKTITKAPGVFGKRTVKKETKFVKNLKP